MRMKVWGVALFGLLLLGFAAGATATNNGLGGAPDLDRPAKIQSEVAITQAGDWYMFAFSAAAVPATGCLPADPAGGSCGLSPGQVAAGAPPWVIEAPAGGTTLTVVDAFVLGLDQFEVFDFGVSIGTTSAPSVGNCSDPDSCLLDPNASQGTFALAAGTHSITIVPVGAEPVGGAAFFRVEEINTIPTLGPLGLGALVLLLVGAGVLIVRKLY